MNEFSCFLGANSFGGFYSLYDPYIAAVEPERLFILKGGAGCGKSGFLRRVAAAAEQKGLRADRILCSGDPDSLDGVWVPERRLALFDGTAPHILEPPQVGYQGFYLDLSRFYRPGVPPLRALERAYREHYRRAYLYLSAAGSAGRVFPLPTEAEAAVRRRARALALRLLKQQHGEARETRVFTDAFTGQGSISLPESRTFLAPTRIALTGGGDLADVFLSEVLEVSRARGHSPVVCPDPLDPAKLAHLLFPEIGLGFTSGAGTRKIHLEKQLAAAADDEALYLRKDAEAQKSSLLHKAQSELKLAKLAHDRLEDAVHPYVDFDAVAALAERFIEEELR